MTLPQPPFAQSQQTEGKTDKQRLALIVASTVGALGTFLPWVYVPIVGSISGTKGGGWLTLALFLLSLVLSLHGDKSTDIGRYKRWGVIVSGFIAGMVGLSKVCDLDSSLKDLANNPFSEAIAASVSIGIGLYAVIFAGLAIPIFGLAYGANQELGKDLSALAGRSASFAGRCVSVLVLWLRKPYSHPLKITIGVGVLLMITLFSWCSFLHKQRLVKVCPRAVLYDSKETYETIVRAKDLNEKLSFELLRKLMNEGRLICQDGVIEGKVIIESGFQGMMQIEIRRASDKSYHRFWVLPNCLMQDAEGRQDSRNPQNTGASKIVKQDERFRLGNYSYIINECESQESIGSGYGNRTAASDGAMFVIVHFTILNESMKTQTVAADDFLIRDKKGREFHPSSKATTALVMDGKNKDFLLRELQPGIERQSITAFELPDDALNGDLFLVVPEKGAFGRKQVIVKISVD